MRKLAIFGFSANPPAIHHLTIVKKLLETFDKVIIIPRGTDSNKPSIAKTAPLQRKDMVKLTFAELSQVEIDYFDLEHDIFTPTWQIDQKYKKIFPDWEIWHAIGCDIVEGGRNNNSNIQKRWRKGVEIWTSLNWAIIDHPGLPVNLEDLPPKSMIIKMDSFAGRSTLVRNNIAAGRPITDLVTPEVEEYIIKYNLYK